MIPSSMPQKVDTESPKKRFEKIRDRISKLGENSESCERKEMWWEEIKRGPVPNSMRETEKEDRN